MYQINVTPADLAVLDRALSARPYGEVADLVRRINQQLASPPPDGNEIPAEQAQSKEA